MNYKYVIVPLLIIVGLVAARLGTWWWTQRQWFDLQAQQLATIERIGEFPPAGWNRNTWKSALITPYNVWGNVTYHPDYSKISNEEMRSLKLKLDRIVAETTRENSIESVDRVFQLLLQRGQKIEFISRHRDEFRTSHSSNCRQLHRPTAIRSIIESEKSVVGWRCSTSFDVYARPN